MASYIYDDQKQTYVENCPGSLTSTAASCVGTSGCESEDGTRVDATRPRADGSLDSHSGITKVVSRSRGSMSKFFSGVRLKVMPDLGRYSNLETLDLSANSFGSIPPGCLPKSLRSLDISNNKIVAIEGLKELTRLRVLNLSNNRILRVGNSLSNCASLKELYLAGNKISEVEGLHRLSRLAVLDLSFNKLTTMKSIGAIAANYKALQSFNVLGNDVYSNVGHETMKRFVTGTCKELLYLNKQSLKSFSSMEALGKDLKGSGTKTAKLSPRGGCDHPFVSSHQRATTSRTILVVE